MFGGTGYLINGNMVAGINKDFYILRLGEKNANSAIKSLNAKLFDITGRPMKGWVMVEESALSKEELGIWVEKAKKFVESMPVK